MAAVAAVADAIAVVARKEGPESAIARTYVGTPVTVDPQVGMQSAIANTVGPTVNPQFTE